MDTLIRDILCLYMAGTVAYSFIITSGFAVVYVILIVLETHHDNRVASDFRLYLDEKMVRFFVFLRRYLGIVGSVYERGSDAVESDLIDPITDPISETQKKYRTLKTGKLKIRRRSVSRTSPYLQNLLKKQKKVEGTK